MLKPLPAMGRAFTHTSSPKEPFMNHQDDKDQLQPGGKHGKNLSDPLSRGKALQESPGEHPDQNGAQYGGYGHSDSPFGRSPGSSSEESGQGGGDAASGVPTEPRTLRGGSDGGSQTRHALDTASQAPIAKGAQPPGNPTAAEQRVSPAPQQQGAGRADQNHQDQGGQAQRGPAHQPAEGNDPSGYHTPDQPPAGASPTGGNAHQPGGTQPG